MSALIVADVPEPFRAELERTLNAIDRHNATMRAIERALSIPAAEGALPSALDAVGVDPDEEVQP